MAHLDSYRKYLKEHLSQKRYIHSMNVSESSAELAKRFGGVDVETARFEPQDVQYTLMMSSDLDVCTEERHAFKVWHGIAGAEMLRRDFGVTDLDILHAVRYHTVGRGGMSQLEKIVYLADMISAERSYPDVDVMRRKTKESLTAGMCYALRYSLQKLLHREVPIPHHTLDAYNENIQKLLP